MNITFAGKPSNQSLSNFIDRRTKEVMIEVSGQLLLLLSERLTPPPISVKYRKLLDLNRIPFITLPNGEDPGTYGHDTLEWLLENEFHHMLLDVVKFELRVFYLFAQKNKEFFMNKKKKKINVLRLIKYVSTNRDIGNRMKSIVEILDHNISFGCQTAVVERLGRSLNLIKTDMRTLLGGKH